MIGAGIAWLAISSRRRDDDDYETGYSAGYSSGYRSGTDHDEHKEGMTDRLKQRASAAGESLRERASDLGERARSEEHTAELQSLMRRSSAVVCLKKKKKQMAPIR